jgi:RimJ/RimL family protein N-acetyltransferase
MTAPMLETERLILRAHGPQDFESIFHLWSRPEVTLYTNGKRASTREESWARLLRYQGLWAMLGYGYFAIIDKANGAFLGEAGLADFHREIEPSLDSYAEAGWALLPDAWGKGFAQEALSAIFEWYAKTPHPRPVACIIDPENAASVQLGQRIGFRLRAQTQYKGSPCSMFELDNSVAK